MRIIVFMKPDYIKDWHPWFFHYALTHRLYTRDFYLAYQMGHEL